MSVFLQLAQWSALHSAAHDDDIASVGDAVTPLFVACMQGHVQEVQRLISVKANVNCVTKVSHDAMGLDSIRCFVLIYKKFLNQF